MKIYFIIILLISTLNIFSQKYIVVNNDTLYEQNYNSTLQYTSDEFIDSVCDNSTMKYFTITDSIIKIKWFITNDINTLYSINYLDTNTNYISINYNNIGTLELNNQAYSTTCDGNVNTMKVQIINKPSITLLTNMYKNLCYDSLYSAFNYHFYDTVYMKYTSDIKNYKNIKMSYSINNVLKSDMNYYNDNINIVNDTLCYYIIDTYLYNYGKYLFIVNDVSDRISEKCNIVNDNIMYDTYEINLMQIPKTNKLKHVSN